MTRTLLGFVACPTLLLLAGSARAATFTVTNTNDTGAGSLRQAVADANGTPGDDEIVFGASLAGQTIVLLTNDATGTPLFGSTALFVSEAAASLTVQGSAAPGLTISGQSARRIFAVQTGATLRLENLTLTNGRIDGGAGGDGDGAGGGAAGMGGGVYAHSGSTLLVLGC
ncbi:MAG: hypothetical protein KDD82_30425, partial [Planctomycetes bacterium]|nr:hypothetical protein [Planctomycetota bacterium]